MQRVQCRSQYTFLKRSREEVPQTSPAITLSVSVVHLYLCSLRAAMDSIYMDEHVSVPIKLYFQKQRMGWIYLRAIMWQNVPVIVERTVLGDWLCFDLNPSSAVYQLRSLRHWAFRGPHFTGSCKVGSRTEFSGLLRRRDAWDKQTHLSALCLTVLVCVCSVLILKWLERFLWICPVWYNGNKIDFCPNRKRGLKGTSQTWSSRKCGSNQ